MLKINEVFFGDHGITSTSANHLANLAKELIRSAEEKLNNLSFVTTRIDIIGSQNQEGKIIQKGIDETFLSEIKPLIERIAEFNRFCSWIREAIKAKESELLKIDYKNFSEWLEENKIKLEMPELKTEVKIEDIVEGFNIKERNELYSLEAVASTIGKLIHKKGNISLARAELQQSLIKPYSATGEGQNTLIFAHNPSVEEKKVDEVFVDLQKWHRSVEQRLNRLKYSIRRKVTDEKIRLGNKKRLEREIFENKKKDLMFRFNEWKIQENERISNLKIVIPEDLQKTYDYLSSLEK